MTAWPQISLDANVDYSHCFCCGKNNPIGLKLNFQRDGNMVKAEFTSSELYQGWPGMVHGGIVICLLDEAVSYAAIFEGMNCVTAELQAKLKRPAPLNEPLVITGTITRKTRKLVETKATVSLHDGTLIAEGTARQFVVNSAPNTAKSKAVIWDMDGVIADTAACHFQAWQAVFQKRGITFSEDTFRTSFGQRNDAIISKILGKTSKDEINRIAREKEESFRRSIKGNIKPLPGVIKLMKLLSERGFKMALASSAPKENIQLLTEELDIKQYFQVVISDEDVTEGKPNPQVFLLAAERLGVEVENCLVIEDAVVGGAAAKRAGMRCLAVTNTHPRTSLNEADIIADTLEAVTISDLEKLFNFKRRAIQ